MAQEVFPRPWRPPLCPPDRQQADNDPAALPDSARRTEDGEPADLRGYLKKKSRQDRWQKRWFEVNDHYLTYYKTEKSDKLLACIDLFQTGQIKMLLEDWEEGAELSGEFSIELGDRFYVIKAETREEGKRWVQTLAQRQLPEDSGASGSEGAAGTPGSAAGAAAAATRGATAQALQKRPAAPGEMGEQQREGRFVSFNDKGSRKAGDGLPQLDLERELEEKAAEQKRDEGGLCRCCTIM